MRYLPRTALGWALILIPLGIVIDAFSWLMTEGKPSVSFFSWYVLVYFCATIGVALIPAEHRNSWWSRKLEYLAPIVGDRRRKARHLTMQKGNDLLRAMNLVPMADPNYYPAEYHQYPGGAELRMQLRMAGIDAQTVDKGARHVLPLVGCPEYQVTQKDHAGGFVVTFYTENKPDPFKQVVPWPVGTRLTNGAVPIGITENQTPATMPLLGGHTTLLGASGSGKGSVMWALLIGLADEIKAGRVKVWGIDLKGGVELSVGRTMFERMAGTVEDAQTLLDDLAGVMAARLADMVSKGQRKITPTVDQPMYLLVIDEAAALTLGVDPKISKAAMSSLRLILTQGRAPGVSVFAALQDPTKEAFPARDLFTRQIILRLRSESQTRLALAVGSDEQVPAAHSIPESTPGVGYIRDAERGEVIKFRAYMVEDELIRHIARDIGDRNVAADQEGQETG